MSAPSVIPPSSPPPKSDSSGSFHSKLNLLPPPLSLDPIPPTELPSFITADLINVFSSDGPPLFSSIEEKIVQSRPQRHNCTVCKGTFFQLASGTYLRPLWYTFL